MIICTTFGPCIPDAVYLMSETLPVKAQGQWLAKREEQVRMLAALAAQIVGGFNYTGLCKPLRSGQTKLCSSVAILYLWYALYAWHADSPESGFQSRRCCVDFTYNIYMCVSTMHVVSNLVCIHPSYEVSFYLVQL